MLGFTIISILGLMVYRNVNNNENTVLNAEKDYATDGAVENLIIPAQEEIVPTVSTYGSSLYNFEYPIAGWKA